MRILHKDEHGFIRVSEICYCTYDDNLYEDINKEDYKEGLFLFEVGGSKIVIEDVMSLASERIIRSLYKEGVADLTMYHSYYISDID